MQWLYQATAYAAQRWHTKLFGEAHLVRWDVSALHLLDDHASANIYTSGS